MRALYSPEQIMTKFMEDDAERFRRAVEQCGCKVTEADPVSAAALRYEADLDIRTAAAGDAYQVVDIVLATHARTAVRSPERERCLTLLDRLIESGAAEADKKADDPTSYWED